ncbi:E3 ubiquitin-protein ligase rififylin [Cricetulus griseus]|uniref:RING-type E3 ubiquitin transferase n=1 Tax=Cricetulus griseus TaxID=10029 RepID=G3GTU4_CRIGR|nr:E3 ubiquitin-protein ligase rififylin [Cricetulus griseus]ERE67510.1 E3 ubiquitin-protein ligase [Cricetulus griseus]
MISSEHGSSDLSCSSLGQPAVCCGSVLRQAKAVWLNLGSREQFGKAGATKGGPAGPGGLVAPISLPDLFFRSDMLSPVSRSKQQTCLDCKKHFCMTCSSQEGNGPRLCLLCLRFRATAFQREELMKMKVKDLRDYLSLHDISTEMCREKEELVFLVLGQQPVISAADRTHAPTLSQGFPEQQAFLTQPPIGTVPPTSADLPSSPAQATSVPLAQAQENQATGHVSQDNEEPVFLESTARVPTEDETQSIGSEDSFVPGRRASLSDLTHLEDIESLTVRQLKEILARNFVNYKGCCEKWELMERVTRLYKDQKGLQHLGGAVPSGLEENLCKICMDSPIDCVLLECGHMVTCTKCGKRMNECPICRQYVIRAVHVFRS